MPGVEDKPAEMPAAADRGEDAATGRGEAGASGWVTTRQAARSLNVSPRTVRWHIDKGHLEARAEGEGVQRTWLVSIDSLQAFRDSRQRQKPRDYRAPSEDADITADIPGSPIRELADRLAEEAARSAEYRVRLELTERAESTIRAELEVERRRREEAERERDELAARLAVTETPREPRGSPVPPAEGPGGAEERPFAEEAQEGAQRRLSWWRRWFGFE